ncbi:MAG: M20/M25/M40 family metallo-hydrolase [Thermotogaceae bacterium]|nr:M20/M25/M40 family metallo-hydrolase [Thermotogaceae bacterium]
METKELLKKLSEIDAPSGMEHNAHGFLKEILGSGFETNLRGFVHEIKGEGKLKVGVFCHLDEIGLLVAKEKGDGFFYLETVGGVDPKILPSTRVKVYTKGGIVRGVIGIIAPHLTPSEKKGKVQGYDDILLDASIDDWKKISIGDRVVLDVKPSELADLITGKALDNRAGCAVLIKTKEFLESLKHEADVYLIFSSMEEIGGPGARSVAHQLELDYALVTDVTFVEKVDGHKKINIGDGPAIGIGPFIDKKLFELAKKVAEKHGIKYQIEALPTRTGTDTDSIKTAWIGIKTLLASVPIKYMHTPVEVVNPKDVEETARLFAHIIAQFRGDKNE